MNRQIHLFLMMIVSVFACDRNEIQPTRPQLAEPARPSVEKRAEPEVKNRPTSKLPQDACRQLLPQKIFEKLAGTAIEPEGAAVFGGDSNECYFGWRDPAVTAPFKLSSVASVRLALADPEDWDHFIRQKQGKGFKSIERDLGIGQKSALAIARHMTEAEHEADRRAADEALMAQYQKKGGQMSINEILNASRGASTPDTHILDIVIGSAAYHFVFRESYISEEELRAELPALQKRLKKLHSGE